jgi:RNA polymerase sigma factor (TIGR02999 family)
MFMADCSPAAIVEPGRLALYQVLAENGGKAPHDFFGDLMATQAGPEISLILARARAGDDGARGEVISRIYDELREVASRMMRRERASHTLSPTAVVHEAVMRLLGEAIFDKASDRDFLFAAAARAMREILVDHARRRAASRRGGQWERVPLDSLVEYFEAQEIDVSEVHEAIVRLTALNERRWGSRSPRSSGIAAWAGPGCTHNFDAGGADESRSLEPDRRAVRRDHQPPARTPRGLAPPRLRR